ncbi:Por secretion system C-terminal sorting domain-containing protein, partial [Flavobacterium gillisiae]
GLASGSVFPIGVTTNTFVVTDASGNTATCSFDVTVNDTQLPTITCNAPITVSNDNNVCGAAVTYTVSSADNCAGQTVAQTAGLASGSVFPIGVTTNTFVVTDASGNTATCSFDVTVNDTQLPTITCNAPIIVSNDNNVCGATVTYIVTSADNCAGQTVAQTAGLASGTVFPIGVTTNSFVVTDTSGNTATCSFDVTVNDTQLPTITCNAPIIVSNDNNVCGATVTYIVTSADNCAGQTVAQTAGLASGTVFPIGVTTNSFVVTDTSGNTATCSFTVTVNDTQLPTITCKSNQSLQPNNGLCTYKQMGTAMNATATDNCSGTTIKYTLSGATTSTANFYSTLENVVFNSGITTVNAIASDPSGNSASCSFTVNVASTLALLPMSSNNPLPMYFGLSGDQSRTITTTPSGGTGSYTIVYTMNRPLNCNVNGGSETLMVTGASVSSATCAPLSSVTVPNGGSHSITIKLMADAIITATVIDRYGCTVTSSIKIWAEDVRCFAGNSGKAKVKICHKTGSLKNPCQEICVDESALQSHLDHGDFVGSCTSDCKPRTMVKPVVIGKQKLAEIEIPFNVIAYPNPSNHQFTVDVKGGSDEKVEVIVYDMLARQLKRIEKNNGQGIQFGEELPSGEYLVLIKQGENQKAINLIKK